MTTSFRILSRRHTFRCWKKTVQRLAGRCSTLPFSFPLLSPTHDAQQLSSPGTLSSTKKRTQCMNESKQISWGGVRGYHNAVWAKVRWKRDGYRTSPIQNRRWLWVFEFDPFRWENRGGFTYTDQRPFRGFATGTKKKKKKRTFVVSGGFVRTPRTPLRTGLLLRQLHWPSFRWRRSVACLTLFHKLITEPSPPVSECLPPFSSELSAANPEAFTVRPQSMQIIEATEVLFSSLSHSLEHSP